MRTTKLLSSAAFIVGVGLTLLSSHAMAASSSDLLTAGDTAAAHGKYDEAMKRYKQACKENQNDCYKAYTGMALVATDKGSFRDADGYANKAISAASTSTDRARGHVLRGTILLRFFRTDMKKSAAAENEFRQALGEPDCPPDARFGLGVALLREQKNDEGKKELENFISVAPDNHNVALAKKMAADPRRAREEFAPDFEVTTTQGQKLSSAGLAGKVVVLDFWATWCPSCRAALSELKDLVKKYPPEKMVLISISADSDAKAWQEYITKKEMTWPQCRDVDEHLQKMFGIQGYPTYLVIDGDGIIRREIIGTDAQKSVAGQVKDTLKMMQSLREN
jgi:peroxiredoxin